MYTFKSLNKKLQKRMLKDGAITLTCWYITILDLNRFINQCKTPRSIYIMIWISKRKINNKATSYKYTQYSNP